MHLNCRGGGLRSIVSCIVQSKTKQKKIFIRVASGEEAADKCDGLFLQLSVVSLPNISLNQTYHQDYFLCMHYFMFACDPHF